MASRQWSMDGLDGRELLDACAHVYDMLDEIVTEAHKQVGASVVSYSRPGSHRLLPCMENIKQYLVIKTRIRKGKEVCINRPRRRHRR